MELEELKILLELASKNISIEKPDDATAWSYNEGIEDLAIELENLINNKNQ